MENYDEAINFRNYQWKHNSSVPNWVDVDEVELDQVFTLPAVAKIYFENLLAFLKTKRINIDDCLFIEPSAGDGSFFKLLPNEQRLGLDVYPRLDGVIKHDFLSWEIPSAYNNKIKIFIGSPPFGHKGWLAYAFLKHAAETADYVAFILPMIFQSLTIGAYKNKIRNMKLIHSEIVPRGSFFNYPLKRVEKINTLWQIWEKGEPKIIKVNNVNDYVDITTINLKMNNFNDLIKFDNGNFFIQKFFYEDEVPVLTTDINKIKYGQCYKLTFKKNKKIFRESVY